jgi:hypothetical protein
VRNFLLGVAVGATGMGLYTGYIRIDVHERLKGDAEKVKDKVESVTDEAQDAQESAPQSTPPIVP